jgi:hypothetical protein
MDDDNVWEYGWEADESIRQLMHPKGPRILMEDSFGTPEHIAMFPKGQRIRRRKAGPWEPASSFDRAPSIRKNPKMPSDEALLILFENAFQSSAGLRAVWRHGYDAGMVARDEGGHNVTESEEKAYIKGYRSGVTARPLMPRHFGDSGELCDCERLVNHVAPDPTGGTDHE